MKTVTMIALVVGLALSVALPAQARGRRATSTTTKPVEQKKEITGKVTEVKPDSRQFKVEATGADKGLHTVTVITKTTMTGAASKLAEMKVGDTVKVRYSYWAFEVKSSGGKSSLRDRELKTVTADSIEVTRQ